MGSRPLPNVVERVAHGVGAPVLPRNSLDHEADHVALPEGRGDVADGAAVGGPHVGHLRPEDVRDVVNLALELRGQAAVAPEAHALRPLGHVAPEPRDLVAHVVDLLCDFLHAQALEDVRRVVVGPAALAVPRRVSVVRPVHGRERRAPQHPVQVRQRVHAVVYLGARLLGVNREERDLLEALLRALRQRLGIDARGHDLRARPLADCRQ
jgi:hypothetical protein